MDINRALRLAISTGRVRLGMAQAAKSVKGQEAKLLILANNCPTQMEQQAKVNQVPTYRFRGNNMELGAACGKPFSISTVTILEEGSSEILALRPAAKVGAVAEPEIEAEPETPPPAAEPEQAEPPVEEATETEDKAEVKDEDQEETAEE